jgi:hypothetical protein
MSTIPAVALILQMNGYLFAPPHHDSEQFRLIQLGETTSNPL